MFIFSTDRASLTFCCTIYLQSRFSIVGSRIIFARIGRHFGSLRRRPHTRTHRIDIGTARCVLHDCTGMTFFLLLYANRVLIRVLCCCRHCYGYWHMVATSIFWGWRVTQALHEKCRYGTEWWCRQCNRFTRNPKKKRTTPRRTKIWRVSMETK